MTQPEHPSDINFQNLVDEYYTPLYRFAYSLSGNAQDAGDLTQQAFLIWARKGASLRDSSKAKSWLFTTLYREFLRVRRRGASVTHQEHEVLEAIGPAVEADVVNPMDGHIIVELLQEVDEVYRTPLTLFYLEDLAYKEIAEQLDVPIGTVMSRLSRGKAQLRLLLLERDRAT